MFGGTTPYSEKFCVVKWMYLYHILSWMPVNSGSFDSALLTEVDG